MAHRVSGIDRLGVMVSGGSDSLALLHLLHDGAKRLGKPMLFAVTVDHGLREDAARECRKVMTMAASMGLAAEVLNVEPASLGGNLMAAARDARYQAVARWARTNNLDAVAVGHTRTDRAETFLMRLARGSGVDGLAGMSAEWKAEGMTWMRPLLDLSRETLRSYLRARDVQWIDDPTNDDDRFLRVQVRKISPVLSEIGLTENRLSEAAGHLARARNALDRVAMELAQRAAHATWLGTITIAHEEFFQAHEEFQLRLLAKSLQWVTGDRYRPRFSALTAALSDLKNGASVTLHGTLCVVRKTEIHVLREPNAVNAQNDDGIWDGRWLVDPGECYDSVGDQVSEFEPNWRSFGLPKEAWMSLPNVFQRGHLRSDGDHVTNYSQAYRLVRTPEDFGAVETPH
ncbi:MAG: tRNA lysidine(34) synthetase TilS [Pseudomonadota bacterium]